MEVILSQNVASLGKTGEVVKVKDGYARNFLIPKKLAYIASATNLKRIEQQEKKRKLEYEAEKKKAETLAEQLNKASCTVAAEVNDLDKLYGAISETEIIKALEVEGFNIDKKSIVVENPIEELGIFEVFVKLHPEVTAKVRLWVTKK
ncbi:MAG: 50S ribosomal protein L9 [Candidatus Omnitrophica bacterium]|nr:50S ribosomal protein L9 [Candidatus Omnitrophota bacterium]MBU1995542.1 50S ribosomal protein L9 [Candidatus Omnitrophota bacterium]MBU4333878.1 50S ribosomal protein L9 [Candidatus Omnitrophota bacterium]